MMEKVSHAELDAFFDDYVYGFIAGDVQREIDRARSGLPAGNFLCALALLCYTEVLGGVQRGTLARGEGARELRGVPLRPAPGTATRACGARLSCFGPPARRGTRPYAGQHELAALVSFRSRGRDESP
jgi:hypothetical protein